MRTVQPHTLARSVLLPLVCTLAVSACGGQSDGPITIGAGGSKSDTSSGADIVTTSDATSTTSDTTSGVDAGAAHGDTSAGAGDTSMGGQADSGGEADITVDAGSFGGVTKPTKPLEITGLWKVGNNSTVHLTGEVFGKVRVVHYDNTKNLAYTTAPVGVSGPGGLSRKGVYSVYQWAEPVNGDTWLCQVDTGLSTEVQALQTTKTADPTALKTGCNLGLWTKLSTHELVGRWESSFGGNETVEPLVFGLADVVDWDNVGNALYTQNPKGTGQNSERFNKIVWTEPTAAGVWYCTVVVVAVSLADAKKATYTIDAKDPDNSGCNNFSWTHLIPFKLIGSYQTSDGELRHISTFWWGDKRVAGFDNDKKTAWLENRDDAADMPGKFSRLVWSTVGKTTWVCATDTGLSDLDAAQNAATTADSSDPANSGCKGKPWTKMDAL